MNPTKFACAVLYFDELIGDVSNFVEFIIWIRM